MKPIRLRNYRRIDTRSSELHAAAETAERNRRNLAHYRHRRLARIMARVDWNLSAFTREVAG